MAFEQLEYTKNWENPEDFPTYENDEVQVREDMQFLYNEVKEFINTKLVALLNNNGAANITTESGKDVETVLAELTELINEVAGGTVPEEGAALSWDLSAGGYRITDLGEPEQDTDAANKNYVATAIAAATTPMTAEQIQAICT